jgi:hypothetical protein
MVHDFNFKIIHHARSKGPNVNASSKNPIGYVNEDENFQK